MIKLKGSLFLLEKANTNNQTRMLALTLGP